MNEPLAVIINTCNRPYMLKNLIKQVASQTRPRDWIIIVNDGEKGNLPEFTIGNIYAIPHCKPYYALASARNVGMNKAIELGYDWGVFIDDDVEIADKWLENHRHRWEDKKTIYAGKISESLEDDIDVRTKWHNKPLREGKEVPDNFLVQMGGCNSGFYLPSLKKNGGFNEEFDGDYGYEDVELAYRLSEKKGWNIEYVENAKMVSYYAPPSGDYKRNISKNREKIEELIPRERMWSWF